MNVGGGRDGAVRAVARPKPKSADADQWEPTAASKINGSEHKEMEGDAGPGGGEQGRRQPKRADDGWMSLRPYPGINQGKAMTPASVHGGELHAARMTVHIPAHHEGEE